jgi:hypothetical protein
MNKIIILKRVGAENDILFPPSVFQADLILCCFNMREKKKWNWKN